MSDHPEVVVAHPGMLVIIIADALPAGQPQLLVGYDGKQPSVLGTPVAGSQVLQDCHQQGSVEAVPLQGDIVVVSTEGTLYGMHSSVRWVLAARSSRIATSRAL